MIRKNEMLGEVSKALINKLKVKKSWMSWVAAKSLTIYYLVL